MDECEDHGTKFSARKHPDFGRKESDRYGYAPDHKRGAGHPAHHTKGKLPSQLQPDHGPRR